MSDPGVVTARDEWIGDDVVVTSQSSSSPGRDAWRIQERTGWDAAKGEPLGWKVTNDDLAALVSVTRCGVLTFAQVRDWFFGGADRTVSRRLAYLERAGLIATDATFDRQWGKLVTVTRRGAEFARQWLVLPLAPYAISTKDLTHMLAVNDIVLQLESQGRTVLTEREVRYVERHVPGTDRYEGLGEVMAEHLVGDAARSARDANNSRRWLAPPMPKEGVHYPDAVVVVDGELCAVEVELTPKEPQRMRKILRAYVQSGLFSMVFWYGTNDVQRLLRGGPARAGRSRDASTDMASLAAGGELRWRDGVLQEMGYAKRGDRNGWGRKPRAERDGRGTGMFVVQPIRVMDEGVMYEVDMKNVPPMHRLRSKPVWRAKRAEWMEDATLGQPAGVSFPKWLVDVDGVLNESIERARVRSQIASELVPDVAST